MTTSPCTATATGVVAVPTPCGTTPNAGAAFDGTSIWVANSGADNVTKVSITSGATSGPFAVGIDPTALAFDGTNVWVADSGSNDVRKIDPASGAVLDMTTVGTAPSALRVRRYEHVGSRTPAPTMSPRSTSRLTAATGPFTVGTAPSAIAFDGSSIWVTNSGTNNVTKLDSSGTVLRTFGIGTAPAGVAFDGLNVWVANSTTNNVTKVTATGIAGGGLNARQVATLHWYTTNTTFKSYPTGQGPEAVAFDGTNVWVANSGSNTITKQSVATRRDRCKRSRSVRGRRRSCFDGTYIWVAELGKQHGDEGERVDGRGSGHVPRR